MRLDGSPGKHRERVAIDLVIEGRIEAGLLGPARVFEDVRYGPGTAGQRDSDPQLLFSPRTPMLHHIMNDRLHGTPSSSSLPLTDIQVCYPYCNYPSKTVVIGSFAN